MKDQRSFTDLEWERIKAEEAEASDEREFRSIWDLFLRLNDLSDGIDITQQDHALMMAHMAKEEFGWTPAANLPEVIPSIGMTSEEFAIVCLLHDVAKPLSLVNHPSVAAEILKHRISSRAYQLIKYHSVFLHHRIHNEWLKEVPNDELLMRAGDILSDFDARAVDRSLKKMSKLEARIRILELYGC